MDFKSHNYFNYLNSYMKSYFKNFSWMMVDNLLKLIFGLTVSIYLTRYLGPKDFGLLSYAISLTGILSPFATLGIDAILLRDIIKNRKNEKILLFTAKILKVISAVLLTIIIIGFIYFFKDDRTLLSIIGIFMIGIILNSLNVYKEYIVAENKMRFIAYASIISIVISNFFKVGLLLIGANVIWFAVAYVSMQLTNVLALNRFYNKISTFQKKYFSKTVAVNLLKDSWPLVFTSFAGIIFVYADQLIIEYFYNYEKVGIYASAVRLILFFTVIPSVISNMIYPKVIEIYENNTKNYFHKKMINVYFLHFMFALFLILIFTLFGELIILTLYGNDFIEAGIILKIYSISFIFVFVNPMNNKLLMIDNLQKLMLVRNLIGLFVNLILNIILIPKFGIIGAALTTVLSQFVILISYYFNLKTRYIFTIQIKAFFFPVQLIKKLF
jgi:O-antigen/teichoic acid export membrane protein